VGTAFLDTGEQLRLPRARDLVAGLVAEGRPPASG
jgi:hypothetical protein